MRRKKSRKIFYLGMVLLAPGIAQLALKRYVTGLIQLLGALVCFVWAAWLLLTPLFVSLGNLLNDSQTGEIVNNYEYLIYALVPFVLLIFLWLWSLIDIAVFYREPVEEPEPETEESSHD